MIRSALPVFDRLFNKRRPKLNDPLFGELTFVKVKKNPSASFWDGRGSFNPTASDIAYFIEAGDAGPCESHHRVYRSIERRYPELLPLITPLLHREYAAQMAANDISVANAKFNLEIVYIPEVESESMEWSLTFSCGDQWPDATFEVHMKGWQPTGIISVVD